MPHVNSDGVHIYYEILGDGPPVVLHHGTTQSLKRWYVCGYVEALRSQYQLILIDPRGHGGSDKPHDPAAYQLDLRIGDVIAVLDHVNLEKVTFWGYSDGGRVGFGLAKRAPERLTALIIGGQNPYEYQVPEFLRLNANDANGCIDKVLRAINVDPALMPPERRQELLANDFQAIAAALQDEPSLEDVLPLMTMPCLVYAGEKDMFFPEIQKAVQAMPNVRSFWLPGVTHPQAFRQSQLVIPHALEFLESVSVVRSMEAATANL